MRTTAWKTSFRWPPFRKVSSSTRTSPTPEERPAPRTGSTSTPCGWCSAWTGSWTPPPCAGRRTPCWTATPHLRAAFLQEGLDRPVQAIPRTADVPWREIDLRDATPDRRKAEEQRVLDEERGHRFDPTRPPLLRLTLIRHGDRDHTLILTAHHILLDGWSVPLLGKELFTAYAQHTKAPAAPALPPVRPYRDFLAWLAAQDRPAAEAAWREALAPLSEPTLLAPAAAGAAVPERHAQLDLRLSAREAEALTAFAAARQLTAATVHQAAWGTALARLTGRADVTFGTTVSGRPADLDGAESMIGLFINTLPVVVHAPPRAPLADIAAALQAGRAKLLGHEHLGLPHIQRLAGLGDLFDTLLVVENFGVDSRGLAEAQAAGGLTVRSVRGEDATHYPVTVVVHPGPETRIALRYRPDLLTAYGPHPRRRLRPRPGGAGRRPRHPGGPGRTPLRPGPPTCPGGRRSPLPR